MLNKMREGAYHRLPSNLRLPLWDCQVRIQLLAVHHSVPGAVAVWMAYWLDNIIIAHFKEVRKYA